MDLDLTKPCLVFYALPEVPVTERIFNQLASKNASVYHEKSVDLATLYESIKALFYKFIDAEAAGVKHNPEDYRWNLYEQLGIPESAFLSAQGDIPEGTLRFLPSFIWMFRRFSEDPKFVGAFTFPELEGDFRFSSGNPGQMPWHVIVKGKNTPENKNSSYGYFSQTYGEDGAYKIHFTPKHEYAFYTMLRLWSIQKKHSIFHFKYIESKILLNFRLTRPNEANTYILETGGGSLPVIVFYGNDNKPTMKEMIEIFLQEFAEEVETIGAMTPDYKYRILPFNVRLNSLLAYALGDRTNKVRARKYYRPSNNPRDALYKEYNMPPWVPRLMRLCKTKGTAAGDLSMRLLGKNLCLLDFRMFLDHKCMDDICWLSPSDDMLDPLTLKGLGLDGDWSKGSDEEADTTANNLVVNEDTEATPAVVNDPGEANVTVSPNLSDSTNRNPASTNSNNYNEFGNNQPNYPTFSFSNLLPSWLSRRGGRRRKSKVKQTRKKQTRRRVSRK